MLYYTGIQRRGKLCFHRLRTDYLNLSAAFIALLLVKNGLCMIESASHNDDTAVGAVATPY